MRNTQALNCKEISGARMKTILIVEDDKQALNMLAEALRNAGYEIMTASDTNHALVLFDDLPDLAIVDIVLEGSDPLIPDGLSLIREVRHSKNKVPIIVLSNTALQEVKVIALRSGADDYLTKPFHVGELLARVEAVFRRCEKAMSLESIRLDQGKHLLVVEGTEMKLTRLEFQIMSMLMARPEIVISRDSMLRRLQIETDGFASRIIDNHIAAIRRKLERVSRGTSGIIDTVHGVGYRYTPKAYVREE